MHNNTSHLVFTVSSDHLNRDHVSKLWRCRHIVRLIKKINTGCLSIVRISTLARMNTALHHHLPLWFIFVSLLCSGRLADAHTPHPDDSQLVEPQLELPPSHKPQRALDLNDKMGISFVEAPLNIRGLALNVGVNSNVFFESIIGGDIRHPTDRFAETRLGVALGLHLQLLQTRDQAALTIGSRFHAYLSEPCSADVQLCAQRTVRSTLSVQYLVDLPLRIYYFFHPNLSIHAEMGISFRWGSSGASSDGISVDGYSVDLFNSADRTGRLGMTFWF